MSDNQVIHAKCKYIATPKMSSSLIAIIIALIGGIWWLMHPRRQPEKRPPGPLGFPIIGHLHLLGKLPHRTLNNLAQKFGPIMSLRLGSVQTIVVSTPECIELFLKRHDTVFANRPKSQAAEYLNYGTKAITFTKYGPYWRNARKFCALEFLSPAKLDTMAYLRLEEVRLVVDSLKKCAAGGEVVDVTKKVGSLIEDMTCRMLFGKSRDERFNFSKLIPYLAHLVGVFNISDYLPILRPLDLQGLTREFKATREAIDKILETIIDDHERDARNSSRRLDRDFADIILSFQNNPTSTHEQLFNSSDRSNVKAILLDMLMAAMETSQNTIDWNLSNLIKYPRVMKRLQEEIKTVVGDSELIEETHLPKLEYLDMIIKETMRLHPISPLLIPHESVEDVVIGGYYIPKNSRILINNWGLGHDPKIWGENVNEFLPERFINSTIDLRGHHFQFLPFGSGRRGCPGLNLALIFVKLVVAQLVHSFNWELPAGMSPEELDMNENFALTCPRAKHILAIPRLRQF